MNHPVFVSMSDRKMASLIGDASGRVAVAVPAVRLLTAKALESAVDRVGKDSVAIVTDCDEEVFRLGYGDFKALKQLRKAGISVRQSSGLRIGVLVCDDQAWVFAPTALYVQDEVQSDETPNAIALRAADVERIVSRLLSPTTPLDVQEAIASAEIEIGLEGIREDVLEHTNEALEQAPPIAFDVARQVRVFEPYIQYVEISLRGCAIERHRVEVPKAIQGIDASAELDSRLRTTFELIEKSSSVSSKPMEKELNEIRDNFTRPLGKPWGRVLLRAQGARFDERIATFKQRLAEHKESVEKSLAEHLTKSRKQLVEYYLPLVRKSPPDVLLGQITTEQSSDVQIRDWLDHELNCVFPEPKNLVTEMALDVLFRGVTYETLNEKGFGEKLRIAYPRGEWDKPFDEFDAAKERASREARNKVEG